MAVLGMAVPPAPLLGVAGRWGEAEVEFARRFYDLHQLISSRGGIRPSNAALEEVAKLVLVRLWSLRHQPDLFPSYPDAGRATDAGSAGPPRPIATTTTSCSSAQSRAAWPETPVLPTRFPVPTIPIEGSANGSSCGGSKRKSEPT